MKTISATVQPRAKVNKVETIGEYSFKVKTTAPAQENKANLAVIKLLAKHLKIRKSQIFLVAGEKSKEKIFQVLI